MFALFFTPLNTIHKRQRMTHTERENNLLKQDLNERGYSEVIVSKSSHFVIIERVHILS